MKGTGSMIAKTPFGMSQKRKPHRKPDDWDRVLERSAPVSPEILRGATELLGTRLERLGEIPSDPERMRVWINRAQVAVGKATRRQHLLGISLAYALYARVKSLPNSQSLLGTWAKEIGKKPTKRTDALHIIIASVISYGGSNPEDRAKARRLHSRDVQAIRYLISEGLSPEAVVKKGAEEGEGLDAWARRYTDLQKSKASNLKPKQQQSYIEWKRKTPDGKTVVVKHISLDHLSPAKQEHLLQRMEEYISQRNSADDSDD